MKPASSRSAIEVDDCAGPSSSTARVERSKTRDIAAIGQQAPPFIPAIPGESVFPTAEPVPTRESAYNTPTLVEDYCGESRFPRERKGEADEATGDNCSPAKGDSGKSDWQTMNAYRP